MGRLWSDLGPIKIVVNDILHKLERQYAKFVNANDPQWNFQKVARNNNLQNFTTKKDPKQQLSTKLSRRTIWRICKQNDPQQQFTEKIYQEDKCGICAVYLVYLFISARRLKIVKDDRVALTQANWVSFLINYTNLIKVK